MKKVFFAGMFLLLILLSGCGVYGTGESYGYITTVEQGIFWDKVWFRAELSSSNTECWIISSSNTALKDELRELGKDKIRVKIEYKRHLWMDEIIGAEEIDV